MSPTPLANDIFFLCGGADRRKLHRHARVGVAAALLAELVLNGSIQVSNGLVTPRRGGDRVGDELQQTLFRAITGAGRRMAVSSWLTLLSEKEWLARVVQRMAAGGLLYITRSKFGRTSLQPRDRNVVGRPAARIMRTLHRQQQRQHPGDVFLGLLAELISVLPFRSDESAALKQSTGALPLDLQDLLRLTDQMLHNVVTSRMS